MNLSLSVIADMINKPYNTLFQEVNRKDITPAEIKGNKKLYLTEDIFALYDIQLSQKKLITFVNQKGGVGKTTLAVNTALALRNYNCKVLLIDYDQQGNVTDLLRIPFDQDALSFYDVAINKRPVKEVVHQSPFENVSVIPTNDREMTYLSNDWAPQYQRRDWQCYFDEALEEFDFIICDLSAAYDFTLLTVLKSCDILYVPVTVEFLSISSMLRYLEKLTEVQENLNSSFSIRIIPNMVNLSFTEHLRNISGIEDNLQEFTIRNPDNNLFFVSQTQEFSKDIDRNNSIWSHSNKSSSRREILTIAKNILEIE